MAIMIGVDTGGTKTLICTFTTDGAVHDVQRYTTPTDPTDYVCLLTHQLAPRITEQTTTAVIGLPGTIHNDQTVWCPNLHWQAVPIRSMLEKALPHITILLENDANLAGIGASLQQDAVPGCALYIGLGTGIGTSIILRGKLPDGLRRSEAGHMLVAYQGTLQCWEHIASARAIHQAHGHLSAATPAGIWHDVAERIACGLYALVPALQPDCILFGGSIARFLPSFGPPLAALLQTQLPQEIIRPLLKTIDHPEEAVLHGCYAYATCCSAG